ncbi:hypothetical protein SISNIDRAFT_482268 [Sistotremastrum niveocremeum HHB9708]|uniref:F-box domain-containing protein n=1 Tax=Sistotremastrum niveocremeum HHB9708 TaxID=1314777 RepID=A0A164YYD7_9AGAM|nr:hypothetical protein SISNIDRAFT_482268 [Sistotremastrum niveocremeum HHB9708]
MHIPPEICRLIAEVIRDPLDVNSPTRNTEDWLKENTTLLALTLVSKTWSRGAAPVLWSEILIDRVDRPSVHGKHSVHALIRASRLLDTLRNTTPFYDYATYLKRLTIMINGKDNTEYITRVVEEILSHSSHLRYLRYSAMEMVQLQLSSLQFPHLTEIKFSVCNTSESAREQLGRFLARHPSLKTVSLVPVPKIWGWYDWTLLREFDPLPNLQTFWGTIPDLCILRSSERLAALKIIPGNRRSFIPELAQLANPFLRVQHLVMSPPKIPLDLDTLKALHQSFPALITLDGLVTTTSFIKLMKQDVEQAAGCLRSLTKITVHESSHGDLSFVDGVFYQSLQDDALDRAFIALPQIFPAIQIAMHLRDERGTAERKLTLCSFTTGVAVFKRMKVHFASGAALLM